MSARELFTLRNRHFTSSVGITAAIFVITAIAGFIVLPFARIGTIPSPDPQTTAAALAGGDTGAPVALGMIGLLPLAVLRRREREQADFLPRRRT